MSLCCCCSGRIFGTDGFEFLGPSCPTATFQDWTPFQRNPQCPHCSGTSPGAAWECFGMGIKCSWWDQSLSVGFVLWAGGGGRALLQDNSEHKTITALPSWGNSLKLRSCPSEAQINWKVSFFPFTLKKKKINCSKNLVVSKSKKKNLKKPQKCHPPAEWAGVTFPHRWSWFIINSFPGWPCRENNEDIESRSREPEPQIPNFPHTPQAGHPMPAGPSETGPGLNLWVNFPPLWCFLCLFLPDGLEISDILRSEE